MEGADYKSNDSCRSDDNVITVQTLQTQFEVAWEQLTTEGSSEGIGKAYDAALTIASQHIEHLVKCGLDAFHRLEKTTRDLNLAKESLECMDRELSRLRNSESKSRETISNLLKAVDTSKSNAREASRAAKSEAGLRAELGLMRSAKDEAVKEATESKRKTLLLEDELRSTKAKLSRVSQEKIKLERENRAALSMAKNPEVETYSTSEYEFYKRKTAALSSHVQTLESKLFETREERESLRRQVERSLSQNQLANIRADQNRKRRL